MDNLKTERIPLCRDKKDIYIDVYEKNCKNYDTFNNDFGLNTHTARNQLVSQVMAMLNRRQIHLESKTNIWSHQPVATVIFICGVIRIISISLVRRDLAIESSEIALLFATCVLNVILSRIQRHRRKAEVLERVQYTLQAILNQQKQATKSSRDPIILSPSPLFTAVYRDSVWQRIPSNLLVEGDTIALVSGDTIPGDVQPIWPPSSTDTLKRGSLVPTIQYEERQDQRQTATFNPSLLLSLCGHMRVFKMKETPVIRDVEVSISQLESRPTSRIRKKTALAYRAAQRIGLGFMVVILVALIIRSCIYRPSTIYIVEDFLLFPIYVVLCFIPFSTPIVFLIGEAVATSRMLATVAALKNRRTEDYGDLDDLDVEERTHMRSKRSYGVTTYSSWRYFLTTLRYRLMNTPAAHRTVDSESSVEPIPYLSAQLIETLGAVTMLCILDDEVLCEPEPDVEEIYLLKDDQSATVVLDLHHDPSSITGLKFENPDWRSHLSSLKPIGMSILLNNPTYSRKHYMKQLSYLSSDSAENSCQGEKMLQRLAAHVRQLPPPDYLIDLAREIGFCQQDLNFFVENQTIHVVEPLLAHEQHTSDTHAQGQQDLRFRGNLRSHLVGAVAMDTRSTSHQLLTRGHPALLLKQCQQYWNGTSICPLTEASRQRILDMFNQWVVENMDCVAFSYSPLSQKYSSTFGSNSFPPVYVVEGENKTVKDGSEVWELQEDQIFLGMIGSSVQPKKEVTGFIEDLMAAGVRFVYFSPRNMRRSKDFAEKMGIETDWNCAISLRSLDSDEPDPHRMTSNYSDWDVKARLPHGVAAIRRHLEQVDNVPLLVSLYTDSTTESIREMITVFQEYEEVVLCVGSSLNEQNVALFTQSDLAIAMERRPDIFFNEKMPTSTLVDLFNESDLAVSRILNTLTCSLTVTGANEPSPAPIVDLIRMGRNMLTNYQQQMVFNMCAQMFLACVITFGQCFPLPQSAEFKGLSVLWFLWIVIPSISLSMIATPSDKDIMKRTPAKNDNEQTIDSFSRYLSYFIIRIVPSAIVAVCVYEWILGESLVYAKVDTAWLDVITNSTLFGESPQTKQVMIAQYRAEAFLMLFVTLSMIVSSASMLHRAESIFVESPLRNENWLLTIIALFLIQLGLSAQCAGADFMGFLHYLPWYFWVFWGTWPIVVLIIDELVKLHDRKILLRHYKFLRMQFDTRLGMWSPK